MNWRDTHRQFLVKIWGRSGRVGRLDCLSFCHQTLQKHLKVFWSRFAGHLRGQLKTIPEIFFQMQRQLQPRECFQRHHPQKDFQNLHEAYLQQQVSLCPLEPPPGLPHPQQVKNKFKEKQTPSEFEINMINSLQKGVLKIKEKSINSD